MNAVEDRKGNLIREKLPSSWMYRRGKVFAGAPAAWGMKGGDGQNEHDDFSTSDGRQVLDEALKD